eukprot:gene24671-33142_t
MSITDNRPLPSDRKFTSVVIDDLLKSLTPYFKNQDLAQLFVNCLPNTLDTTVYFSGDITVGNDMMKDSFVITGDITALWLRDSMNQVMPYIPYASQDPELLSMVEGLIGRHARSVMIDSFANAYNFNASGDGHQSDVRTPPMTASIFEGKYEIDSLCAFLKLSYWTWKLTSDQVLFRMAISPSKAVDESDSEWLRAVEKTIDTIRTMQLDDGKSKDHVAYMFQRNTVDPTDSLMMGGRGPPGLPNGLSRSAFRPSDDACTLPYNIPGNAMACVELGHVQEMLRRLVSSDSKSRRIESLLSSAASLQSTICNSLTSLVAAAEKDTGVLPYEVDGYGDAYHMDDANVPSLLSLPLLGFLSADHPVYRATRQFSLSARNPYFFNGTAGQGVGSPHGRGYNYTWPIGIVVRAMTSDSDEEIQHCLDMLVRSAKDTGFMHESFNVDDPSDFTRSWFAWANGLFGELILQLIVQRPHMILVSGPQAAAAAQAVQPPVSMLSQPR